jgi:hypothetical protein
MLARQEFQHQPSAPFCEQAQEKQRASPRHMPFCARGLVLRADLDRFPISQVIFMVGWMPRLGTNQVKKWLQSVTICTLRHIWLQRTK